MSIDELDAEVDCPNNVSTVPSTVLANTDTAVNGPHVVDSEGPRTVC